MPVNANTNSSVRVDTRVSPDTNTGVHSGTSTTVNIQDRGGSSRQAVTGSSRGGNMASMASSSSQGAHVASQAIAAANRQYAAQQAAAEAERRRQEEEARREAERQRNEQLRRQNDTRIAQNAREAQASREAPDAMVAARQVANPVAASTTASDSTGVSPRVTTLSADSVSAPEATEVEKPSGGLPLINTDGTVFDSVTGEVLGDAPIRSTPEGIATAQGQRVEPTSSIRPSVMAEAIREANENRAEQAQDQIDRQQDVLEGVIGYGSRNRSNARQGSASAPSAPPPANPGGPGSPEGPDNPNGPVPPTEGIMPGDEIYRMWQDVTDAGDDEKAQAEILRSKEERRYRDDYREMMQRGDDYSSTNFDAQDHNLNDNEYVVGESESFIRRKLRNAQNKIIERFLNPSLVHIRGEYIEAKTFVDNGQERTYGRLRYSDMVETAIGSVRRTYNCSIHNVMQLIQLRAGLGVDSNGKIANIDPNEFMLTEDQVVELCRDIVTSQRQNGNPLGPVTGKPGGNGVRDDTGRFVVVAKTRCFPLGYMPLQLIRDLRCNPDSPLNQMSERQIQTMIGNQWINETYPILLANTGGNLMWQARAIENMMRGLMMADGKNPSSLDIPDIVERQTLMALRAEAASVNDPDIAAANEVKRSNLEKALSQWTHRFMKQNGKRSSDGSIDSAAMKRRRNRVGDAFRTMSMLQRAAKAANIGVMISSIPEAWVAEREQSLANLLSDAIFKGMHGDVAKNYEFTDHLRQMSETKEAIEAREVAESLYRIGGHMAIDAFLTEMGDDGRARNHLTRADLNSFLQRYGVYGPNSSLSDMARQAFGVKPGEEAGFLSNLQHIVDGLDNMMLGSNMFKESESRQFVQMSMAEMARSSLHGRESYTSQQVQDWGEIGGGEELIRSLMQTDAGREAFMTQGITSLGRKSPIEHQMRLIMAKNGLTEFAVRTMFDRFPEYGVNKILQMVPFSNTLSYLSACGVKSVGDILATANADNSGGRAFIRAGEAMQRNFSYQVGASYNQGNIDLSTREGRRRFREGLRKNLLYDTIMGGEKLMIAGIYCGWIIAMGGVQPPDDDEDRYTWSEWKIGDGEDAVPIKWAWWMDDLSGVGLPLGMAWAICMQDDWSSEAKQTATNTFINAIANFNSGTAVFDAIDLVNNFDEEWDATLGMNIGDYDPGYDEWGMTMLEQGFWNIAGDLTPTFIGQLTPWSRDYLFRGDADAHTASKVYDVGEGSKYSMQEAQEGYHTRRTGSYADYMRRRSSQTNILQAMFYDWWMGAGSEDSAITGYKYTEQPLDTMVDPYAQAMYDRFFLDLDPATSDISIDNQKEREAELDARASEVVQWIDNHYQNATQANLDGFVLNYEARVNCINYCYKMIDRAWDDYHRDTEEWLPDDEYDRVVQNRQDKIEHYQNLIYNYFQSDDIPWSLPRYVRQESDRETRYVDENGNAMTYLDTLGSSPKAHAESYWYGNRPSLLPLTSPRTAGKGYNYETIPYWTVLDEDGNPVNDVESAYDNAGNLVAGIGRNTGKNVRELMWGGQGTNMGPEADEELHIERGGVPTIGSRPWRLMEETFPESLRNLDADTVSQLLGIPSSLPTEDDESNDTDDSTSGGRRGYGGGSYYGGRSYRRSYYGGGGGSNYNPKIYSSSRQVYSQRASGLQTRQPYKATTTYLRPAFYTKGSREAYKRSDL